MNNPASESPSPVRWTEVRKRRGTKQALDGFSLSLQPGNVCGLIGPNGAGKTTALQLLLGMLRPDEGRVEVFGQTAFGLPWRERQRIGYLAESSERHDLPNLCLPELLAWQSSYFEQWDQAYCKQLATRLGAVADQRLSQMSEGQRRRVELVLALAHRPQLLVLDDPALGLDALARRELLWATIDAVRDEGTTVVFTSHVLQDVERIVDDVAILVAGRIVLQGPLEDLKAGCRLLVMPLQQCPPEPLPGELRRAPRSHDMQVLVSCYDDSLQHTLAQHGTPCRVEPIGLEDLFCLLASPTTPTTALEHSL